MSKELSTAAFSFHIHDSDLWMYVLYANGEIADQFNPIPNYWTEDISEEEIESWKGNAAIVLQYTTYTDLAAIENYLVRWDEEMEGEKKAYPDDTFTYEDYQVIDFMRKLGLPYPLTDDGDAKGDVYQFWTKDLPLAPDASYSSALTSSTTKKPWWIYPYTAFSFFGSICYYALLKQYCFRENKLP